MKRLLFITAISLLFSACSTTQLQTNKFKTATHYPNNEIPMYGGEDQSTIIPISSSSERAAELGWKYCYEGDYSTAMKRFNQAWMFDNDNPQLTGALE